MDAIEMHYQFKINMDRVDSMTNVDFNKAEIDWLLNEAQSLFVEQRYSKANPKREAFEESQKRIDDLATLVVKYPDQPGIVPTISSAILTIDLSTLIQPYLHLVNVYCISSKDGCTYTTQMWFAPHDKITSYLRDPFNSPDSSVIPYNIGRNSAGNPTLYIYPGSMTITEVRIEYLKVPRKISYGNYTYIDGVIYPPSASELPASVHREIVDIACQLAANNIASPQYTALKNEKVFLSN